MDESVRLSAVSADQDFKMFFSNPERQKLVVSWLLNLEFVESDMARLVPKADAALRSVLLRSSLTDLADAELSRNTASSMFTSSLCQLLTEAAHIDQVTDPTNILPDVIIDGHVNNGVRVAIHLEMQQKLTSARTPSQSSTSEFETVGSTESEGWVSTGSAPASSQDSKVDEAHAYPKRQRTIRFASAAAAGEPAAEGAVDRTDGGATRLPLSGEFHEREYGPIAKRNVRRQYCSACRTTADYLKRVAAYGGALQVSSSETAATENVVSVAFMPKRLTQSSTSPVVLFNYKLKQLREFSAPTQPISAADRVIPGFAVYLICYNDFPASDIANYFRMEHRTAVELLIRLISGSQDAYSIQQLKANFGEAQTNWLIEKFTHGNKKKVAEYEETEEAEEDVMDEAAAAVRASTTFEPQSMLWRGAIRRNHRLKQGNALVIALLISDPQCRWTISNAVCPEVTTSAMQQTQLLYPYGSTAIASARTMACLFGLYGVSKSLNSTDMDWSSPLLTTVRTFQPPVDFLDDCVVSRYRLYSQDGDGYAQVLEEHAICVPMEDGITVENAARKGILLAHLCVRETNVPVRVFCLVNASAQVAWQATLSDGPQHKLRDPLTTVYVLPSCSALQFLEPLDDLVKQRQHNRRQFMQPRFEQLVAVANAMMLRVNTGFDYRYFAFMANFLAVHFACRSDVNSSSADELGQVVEWTTSALTESD